MIYTREEVKNMLEGIGTYTEESVEYFLNEMTPKEISDEEIQKWIDSTPYYGHCTTEYKEGLEDGIKWYREQLKKK